MDLVALMVTALAAGAAQRLKDTASTTCGDGYSSRKIPITRRLAGHVDGDLVPTLCEGMLLPGGEPLEAAEDAHDMRPIPVPTRLLRAVW